MTKTDLKGRDYAKLSGLKPGMFVQVDGDFDCIEAGATREVKRDPDAARRAPIQGTFTSHFALYVDCACGGHCLEAQIDDDGDSLLGIYPANAAVGVGARRSGQKWHQTMRDVAAHDRQAGNAIHDGTLVKIRGGGFGLPKQAAS